MATTPTPVVPPRACGPALARFLLDPRSVAIVGASDDSGKTAGRPLRFLRQAGFAGAVYPVNPRRRVVQGEKAWDSLAALPEVPEHVFVLTASEKVVETVAECASLGVKLVTILASGFAESGAEGAQRELQLRQIVRQSGIRVIGPSSLGVVNPRVNLLLTANAAFAEPDTPIGRVFVASHSGSMIGALVSRGRARGVGFAGLVSVGSEIDLSVGEICAATLDDAGIDGYVLFLESLKHGADLRAFAIAAARRGKPVIAYKLGRSTAAAEMALTHTGALAGEDDVADAFLRECGIARVDILEALLESQPLASAMPLDPVQRPRKVGIVTTTGGGAAMVVDQLGVRGIDAEPASSATLAKLAAAGVPVSPGRVTDLTLAGARYDVMKSALDVMLAAPEFDLVLAVVGSSARSQPELAVKPIIDSAGSTKPLAAMIVPDAPQAIAQLTAAKVPCFRTPEACADVIAAVFGRRSPLRLADIDVAAVSGHGPGSSALSEAQAYQLLESLGVAHAPYVLTGPDWQAPPDLPFDYPVAVKVCAAEIPHKTEVGGVVLDVHDKNALEAALSTLRVNLRRHAPHAAAGVALIQSMTRGLGEVLIGYKVDADAGPIIMLAAGGIWAEIARDRSIRLAPVSVATAEEMIGEVRALRTVAGTRGKQRGDLRALAHAISALSQLAVRPGHRVQEAEINPMMILAEGQGVLAVDALVVTATIGDTAC